MRVLELTNYSAGGCGVFARVKQEAALLAKKHDVYIFSSNHTKGSDVIASAEDTIGGVKIKRFPAVKRGGESFLHWNFEKAALDLKPDVIIAHAYRHAHTTKAIKIAKKLNAKVFLVTHAPFVEGNVTRSFIQKTVVWAYDRLIGPQTLNAFDKIIAITKWEFPLLEQLGVRKEKISYIPNGIPQQFFTQKKSRAEHKVLFLGRIAPVKDLATLIKAFSMLEDKKLTLELVGPAEKEYLSLLKDLAQKYNVQKRVMVSSPVYDLTEKIKKIDSAKVFVLPSKTEAMPQSLIEAMARQKIVVGSDNRGCRALIQSGKNGLLFARGNAEDLAVKIKQALNSQRKQLATQASKDVQQFSWNVLIKKIEALF